MEHANSKPSGKIQTQYCNETMHVGYCNVMAFDNNLPLYGYNYYNYCFIMALKG